MTHAYTRKLLAEGDTGRAILSIEPPPEPGTEDRYGGCYQRFARNRQQAVKIAKELVGKHYPAPDFDPLEQHMPLAFQALIFIGAPNKKPTVGGQVAHMGALEELGGDVLIYTILKVADDLFEGPVYTLGTPVRKLVE